MDAKALAKSKRAHSQYHSKKSHSHQKPKTPSHGSNEAGGTKNSPGNQVKVRNFQPPGTSKLPSNWDRYGEQIHPGSEETSNEAAPPVPDVILPKSKGADYRHLIAEAQSEMQLYTYVDIFPSLDDILPRELSSGRSAMLAVRGEGNLSWLGDESFIVDEKATANPEAAFLSLNLHTLAEQLEKINLAERLFIDKDILPAELLAERKAACDQQSSHIQTFDFQDGAGNIEESPITELDEKGNTGDSVRDFEAASSGSFKSIHQDRTFNPSPISSNQVKKVDPIELKISSRINASKYAEQPDVKFMVENASKKSSTFEAAAAEAELDLLLSSFSETIGLDDPGAAPASNTSDFDEIFKTSPQPPGPDLANKAPVAVELDDDALDDLLQETSILTSHKEKSVHSHIPSLPPHSETKSIAKDDFDSWLDTL